MKSSTQQKVSQLVQNCEQLPEILNTTTVTIFTRDLKAVWKYSLNCQIYERLRWNTEKLKFQHRPLAYLRERSSATAAAGVQNVLLVHGRTTVDAEPPVLWL